METRKIEKLSLDLFNDSKIEATSLRQVYGGLMCSRTMTANNTYDCSTHDGGFQGKCDASIDTHYINDSCDANGVAMVNIGEIIPDPYFEDGFGTVQAIEYCGGECEPL